MRLILQGPHLTTALTNTIASQLHGSVISNRTYAMVECPSSIDPQQLRTLRQSAQIDINLLPSSFQSERTALLVTDMDSTLINIECIDEIADFAGLKPQVAAITESAMRGELNFEASLTRRVALLQGLPVETLERVYQERLKLNLGAEKMMAGLKRRGIKVALVSGGFTYFTDRLKLRLGLDYTQANTLEVIDGKLSGRVVGTILGAEGKAEFLTRLCTQLGIEKTQAVAMGDGANDLKMMALAGLSIAYHAKPAVQDQAHTALNYCGLEGVLGLLDIGLMENMG